MTRKKFILLNETQRSESVKRSELPITSLFVESDDEQREEPTASPHSKSMQKKQRKQKHEVGYSNTQKSLSMLPN